MGMWPGVGVDILAEDLQEVCAGSVGLHQLTVVLLHPKIVGSVSQS